MRPMTAVLALIPLAVPQCVGGTPRSATCRAASPQIAVTGPQRHLDTPIAARSTLRATGASWGGFDDYPVSFLGPAPGACVVGGTIVGPWPDSDPWTKWHYRGALRFSQPDFTVSGVHIVNTGDGVKPKDSAGGAPQGFAIESSWIQHAHDDCIENDYLHAGAIRDNLLDGCYVMLSSRPSSSLDGRNNEVVIDRNVGALEPMRSVYKGGSPGTGGFFKWSDRAPKVVLTDNVFMAQQIPNHGTLGPPTGPLVCSGNTIVWTGVGAFPNALQWVSRCPDTVITTDASVYTNAKATWLAAHPTVG